MTSFATDVVPLFNDGDVACMKGKGVNLTSFIYMSDASSDPDFADHANARHVLARVKGDEVPRMPLHAPAWAAAQIATLEAWIDGGFQP